MQSIEERAAAAYELKATGKCNCSQSVVKVFQDKLPVDEDTLMKLTAGYAAGMGCLHRIGCDSAPAVQGRPCSFSV